MPLIELSRTQLLLLIFIISPLVELAAVLIGRKVPLSMLTADHWLYKQRDWEQDGDFYREFFKVHIWKKYLPDGAKFFKGDFTKSKMLSFNEEYIRLFIAEACRAELVHLLMFIPFIFYYLIAPPIVATVLLIVSGFINIPCIIAQRYNRPRLKATLERRLSMMKLREEEQEEIVQPIEHLN